jgi:methylenetetrahydrofolate reductase (NADPH)
MAALSVASRSESPSGTGASRRYEILPFARAEAQAVEVGRPLRLTVTTSPRHGVDRSLDVAVRLRALGHGVTVHIAARMVRSASHLDEILGRARDAGIDDFFVIGGDAPEAQGPYADAGALLDALVEHPLRPAVLGIGGYPEGHPLIEPAVLTEALDRKAQVADYIVTQLCFDKGALLGWIEDVRARGVDLPIHVGAVGPIERRKLLEISVRIGVGPSLRFVRKQRGLLRLFGNPFHAATRFYDDIAPLAADPRYGIAGFHFFTFNRLVATRDFYESRQPE